jgi:hypothetical protein
MKCTSVARRSLAGQFGRLIAGRICVSGRFDRETVETNMPVNGYNSVKKLDTDANLI